MAAPSSTSRLRRLLKQVPDERIIRGLIRVIQDRHVGTDYPVAIMGAAILERSLKAAILSRFVPLDRDTEKRLFDFEQKGCLADMDARIRIGLALGLYGPMIAQDLHTIRTIRNTFAHWPSLFGFDNADVVEACRGLQITHGSAASELDVAQRKPIGRYVSACLEISARLRQLVETSQPVAKPTSDLP
jgi:hypothetical protein